MGTPLSDAFERAVETQVFQGNLRSDFQPFMQMYLTWGSLTWALRTRVTFYFILLFVSQEKSLSASSHSIFFTKDARI
jgi:hypothetical protein